MRIASCSLLLFTGVAALAAPPRITNANLQTRAVSDGLDKEVQAIASKASERVWIAWTAPMIDGHHQNCGTAVRLEGERDNWSASDRPGQPADLIVLLRAESARITKVRFYSTNCEIDAVGRTVYLLSGVRPADSIATLRGLSNLVNESTAAIAMHADPAADTTLDQIAADPKATEHAREQAIFWMGAARGRRGFESLKKIVHDQQSDHLRDKAVFALFVSHEPEATDTIIDVARNDKSDHVRGQALFWLGQKAGKKATAALSDAIDNDPDTAVKEKAVFALSQLPKDEGVPKLIQVARTNKNLEVRKKAMFWLGQSRDPRALEFFEQVLRSQ